MTQRTYRTANGKVVDIGALQLQNENVRAVGNMSVNARGDLLDSNNKPISRRNQQVARQYRKQTTNVSHEEVVTSRRNVEADPVPAAEDLVEFDETENIVEPVETPVTEEPAVGLAAAIAKARQLKQEPVQSPRRTPTGIKKI